MKEIAKIMMNCLALAVSDGETPRQENISAEQLTKLYALSAHHDLAHLVASALETQDLLGESPIREHFERQQMLAIFREANQSEEFRRICQVFEEEKIDYLPLKGAVIRELYPEPWMRTGCDIDILVRPETLDRAADAICRKLGYLREGRNSHDLSLMSANGVQLELHFDTIEEDCAADSASVLQNIWSHARLDAGTAHRYRLSDAMFYFYHIAHMAKHFEHGGCGVKPFLDMWLLCHRVEFDREERRELLASGGLLTFAEAAERLSEAWFSGAAWDALCEDMSRYLLRAGVYGTVESKVAVGQAKRGSRGKNLWSRIWLPYDILKRHYPSLEGHRLLVLFYQIRRWFGSLTGRKMKQTVSELRANSSVAEAESQAIASLLTQLEL